MLRLCMLQHLQNTPSNATNAHIILETNYQHAEYAENFILHSSINRTLLNYMLCVCPLSHCTALFNLLLQNEIIFTAFRSKHPILLQVSSELLHNV